MGRCHLTNCFLAFLAAIAMSGCDMDRIESNELTVQGMKYYNSGNVLQAMNAFRSAVTKDPNNDQALYRLAQLEMVQHSYDEAKTHLGLCISLRPDVAQYYYQLGSTQYDQALSLPDSPESQIAKERLYGNCIDAFKKAIELDPAFSEAHLRLGRCYLADARFEDAVRAFEQSIIENPNLKTTGRFGTAIAFKELGILYANFGFYDKAIAVFMQGIRQNPGDFELETEFANVYQDMGRYKEASAHFEGAYDILKKLGGESERSLPAIFGAGSAHYALAKAAQKDGKVRESLDEYALAQQWFKRFNAHAVSDDVRAQRQAANAYISEIDGILKNDLDADEE